MWNLRSAAHHVAPAFICLISTLIAGGANAQTATDATDTKRVQVLQIREAGATNESSAKKSKTAGTPAKRKVVQQKAIGQTKAVANEDAHAAGTQIPNPNTPVQSTMAVVAPATPAHNDGVTVFAEQTGTLAVGDRAVALASSPGDDNDVDLSTTNYVGTREDQSARALTMGNPPRAAADAEPNPGTQMVGPQVPSSRNSPLSQSLATLSGAMLAAAFGWYLVNSSRRRAFG
jgi:hypothetical protein